MNSVGSVSKNVSEMGWKNGRLRWDVERRLKVDRAGGMYQSRLRSQGVLSSKYALHIVQNNLQCSRWRATIYLSFI
jgi:predicted transcriptional regulator YheO